MSTSLPNKVCSRCGAMNQTVAKKCPSCGKPYKRRTFLKVLAGVFGAFLLLIVLIVVLIGAGASEVSKQLDKEQRAHAISLSKYRSMQLGWSEARVISHAGKQPENRQEFENESFIDNEPSNSSCIYYNRTGGDFGDTFQFCFDEGKLRSKNSY